MRYKILGTNHIRLFVRIMTRLQITHTDAMSEGVSEDDIQRVDKVAKEQNIIILALPDNTLSQEDMGRVFKFVPINKSTANPNGVFVPMEVGKDVQEYDNFIEAPMFPPVEQISDLSKIFPEHEAGKKTEMGHIGKVLKDGRPSRGTVIGDDDIKKMNKLLKPGDDEGEDIDVNDFLKLIE